MFFDKISSKILTFLLFQEYELKKLPNQCCGKCVQTKCSFNNNIHKVGDVWKSDDNCTFNECSLDADNKPSITSYRKSCPKLQPCHPNNIYIDDCCQYCNTTQKNKEARVSSEHDVDIMNYETYKIHPCHRDCIDGAEPMTCSYTFVVKHGIFLFLFRCLYRWILYIFSWNHTKLSVKHAMTALTT
jgi:hypothetical protein